MVCELVEGPGRGEVVRVEVHADAKCGDGGTWGEEGKSGGVPPRGGFLSPRFVRVVEVRFAVMREHEAGGGDGHGGVVADQVRGELGIAHGDDALEARCGCLGPLERHPRRGGLQERRYCCARGEIVACIYPHVNSRKHISCGGTRTDL